MGYFIIILFQKCEVLKLLILLGRVFEYQYKIMTLPFLSLEAEYFKILARRHADDPTRVPSSLLK